MYVSFKMCNGLYSFQNSFKWHGTILQCRGLIWNQMELRHQYHSIISNVIKLNFFSNFALSYKLNFYKLIPIFKWIDYSAYSKYVEFFVLYFGHERFAAPISIWRKPEDSFICSFHNKPCQSPLES